MSVGLTRLVVFADIAAMKEVLVTKWSAFRGRPDFIMPLRGPRLRAMARALVFNTCAPPPLHFPNMCDGTYGRTISIGRLIQSPCVHGYK